MHLEALSLQGSVLSSPWDVWRQLLAGSLNYVCSAPPGKAYGCSALPKIADGSLFKWGQSSTRPTWPVDLGQETPQSLPSIICLAFRSQSLLIQNLGQKGEECEGLTLSKPYTWKSFCHVTTQQEVDHLWTRKWVLTRDHIYWWLDLGFPILQKQGIGRVRTRVRVCPEQTLDPAAISAFYSVVCAKTSLHGYTFPSFESNRPLFYSVSPIILHMLPFFKNEK